MYRVDVRARLSEAHATHYRVVDAGQVLSPCEIDAGA